MSKDNPFGTDTSMAKKNELKEKLEFAIADSHILLLKKYVIQLQMIVIKINQTGDYWIFLEMVLYVQKQIRVSYQIKSL